MFVLVAQLWSQHPFVFFQSKNDLGLSLNRLLIVSSRPNVKAIFPSPLPTIEFTQRSLHHPKSAAVDIEDGSKLRSPDAGADQSPVAVRSH
jgi:hypothetical protein